MTINHEDLIATANTMREQLGDDYVQRGSILDLWLRTADALESTTARLREVEREMHARELHHFEEEKLRAEAEARAERYQGLSRRTELQCQDAEARLREAEEAIENTSHIHGPRKVWESDRAYTLVCTVCITEQYPCATVRTLSRYKPTTENGEGKA